MESGIVKIIRGNEYYSKHNDTGLPYYRAHCELIDNSLDNKATRIEFILNDESITIVDNGTGIKDTREDMERVLAMYESSNEKDPSKIGEYGIGLKDASMRLGKGFHIKSKAPGCKQVEIDIPWENLDYNKGAEFRISENGDMKQGTSITIFYDENDKRNPSDPDKRSFKYYDKMIESKDIKIICDEKEHIPSIEPVFDGVPQILNNINFDGKKFDIKIGILSKGISNNPLTGFYVYSKETLRYYQAGDTNLGDIMDAKDGLYVSIGLYGTKIDWPVDKNKRGIINIDIVAKYLDTYGILEKWKQKLYNSRKTNKLSEIEEKLTSFYLKPIIGKEKRKKIDNGNKGTVDSANSGHERLKADKVEGHDYRKVVQKHGNKIKTLNIVESNFDPSKYLSINKSGRILTLHVNKKNPFINQLLFNKTIDTGDVLIRFLLLALKAYEIPENEIKNNIVDELFQE